MAEVPYTLSRDKTFGNDVQHVSWLALAKGDTGQPFENPGWADRSIQITGTFDSATCTFEGSNDGSTWVTLLDPQGNAISKTSAALEAILENTRYVRPAVAGSGGSAALNFYLCARRP